MGKLRTRLPGAVSVILVLASCSTNSDPDRASKPSVNAPVGLASFYNQQVTWGNCGEFAGASFADADSQCAQVEVPREYADPSGKVLRLAVLRHNNKGARGSLFVNPGGPGASAMGYAAAAASVLTPQINAAYNVVGVDPRGAGDSEPVECVTDAQLDEFFALDGTPDTPAEEKALIAASQAWGPGCQQGSPEISPFVDTIASARDLDVVRAVLGDEKIAYLGKSYGTLLGATYADLFPDRVASMVLDGVLPSSLNSDDLSIGQAQGFELALARFVADCITRTDCPLPAPQRLAMARLQSFLDSVDTKPLPGIGERKVTQGLATYAILSYLYAPPYDWQRLREGLAAALQGDGSVLMQMLDERIERNSDGTYANNANEAFLAISCLERPAVGGVDHVRELVRDWQEPAPILGAYFAWATLPCWNWPMGPGTAAAAGPPPVIRANGSPPILVVSTTNDPATPHEWGVEVAGELEKATLLTYDGDGHTAYVSGSTCIDDAVDNYLLKGQMPVSGTACRPDSVR